MKIALIVAMDRQGVIGNAGSLPWHLRSDLQRFKKLTMGHAMVMGRKTYDSIGRPLPGRLTIVLTRSASSLAASMPSNSVRLVESVGEAIEVGRSYENERVASSDAELPEPTLCIVGGGEIYSLFLDRADELHLTRVQTSVEGDTRFPAWDESGWSCVEELEVSAGEHDAFDSLYQRWIRRI